MMKKISYMFATFIIGFFTIFGFFMFSTLMHEYSHVHDFKDLAVNEGVCILADPFHSDSLGYYQLLYNAEDEKEVMEISGYTEFKAYCINILLLLTLFISLFIYINKK